MTTLSSERVRSWEVHAVRVDPQSIVVYILLDRDAAIRVYNRASTIKGFRGYEIMLFASDGEAKLLVDFAYNSDRRRS